MTTVSLTEVEQFVYHEARLADEHTYDEWESLWTDDGRYWVPAGDDTDPDATMSVINDNRGRIHTRIEQLQTGRHYSQAPPSRLARTVSNIELLGVVGGTGTDATDLAVAAAFVLVEATGRATNVWAGRLRYHLRPLEDGLAMSYKKVDLVDRPWALPTLAFII